jgi:hypothetical protein
MTAASGVTRTSRDLLAVRIPGPLDGVVERTILVRVLTVKL